ncbi:hypothetical protein [Rhizobium ruizarguesonis]|uniref:hypothetical protein n=1 Tax=Rhizobium ruizarguesonis TaxID=2081791 RepID=UPI0013BFFF7C|nr:hypothetical protein [Rhizobium ruizarguesonis]NEI98972.1 hypothetical protein [Rhizobium ruizarguesonis]NEJ35072.1 hypothetical protein [Rhizobium ruizarguesonis]
MCNFIRCFMIGPFISVFLSACFVLSSPAIAAANQENMQAWEKEVGRLFRQGDCAQAWQAMWKEARKGNTAALNALYDAIASASIVPPSYFPLSRELMVEQLGNHIIALAIYSRKDEKQFGGELRQHGIPDGLFGEYMEPEVSGKIQSVNKCFKSKGNLDDCYALAVKLRLIPSFEQYVTLMDNAPRPAFCPRHAKSSGLMK